jgi:hypothetical protein
VNVIDPGAAVSWRSHGDVVEGMTSVECPESTATAVSSVTTTGGSVGMVAPVHPARASIRVRVVYTKSSGEQGM